MQLSDGLRTIVGGASPSLSKWDPQRSQQPRSPPAYGNASHRNHVQRREERSDYDALLSGIGKMWLSGVSIRSPSVWCIPLPSYPFERQRYWINPVHHPASRELADSGGDKYTTPVWMMSTAETVAQPPGDLLLVGSPGGACDSILRSFNTLGGDARSSPADMTGNAPQCRRLARRGRTRLVNGIDIHHPANGQFKGRVRDLDRCFRDVCSPTRRACLPA